MQRLWRKICSIEWFNQYYQYVIQARLQGRYEDVTEWPKLGTETYLKQLNNKDIHRCIILAKGSYQDCQDKLGCALVHTLKDNSRLSVHNTTFMSETIEPFRVRLSDVNKKRLIASEFEETNASRKFYLNNFVINQINNVNILKFFVNKHFCVVTGLNLW